MLFKSHNKALVRTQTTLRFVFHRTDLSSDCEKSVSLMRSVMLLSLKWTIPTGIVGAIMFAGSIHAGGNVFFISMYVMPPLYLLYIGMWPINNLFVSLIPLFLLQYILWLLISFAWLSVFKKTNGSFE